MHTTRLYKNLDHVVAVVRHAVREDHDEDALPRLRERVEAGAEGRADGLLEPLREPLEARGGCRSARGSPAVDRHMWGRVGAGG